MSQYGFKLPQSELTRQKAEQERFHRELEERQREVASMGTQQRERILKEIENERIKITDALLKGENQNDQINSIPERYFVGIYLPFFAGQEVIIPDQRQGRNRPLELQDWINVAGSPSLPVNVIDEHGMILYQVPPAYVTMQILTTYEAQEYSLSDVFKRVNEEVDVYPQQANDLAYHELAKRSSLESKPVKDEVAQAWYQIFSRYGYLDRQEASTTQATPTQRNDLLDDIQWT